MDASPEVARIAEALTIAFRELGSQSTVKSNRQYTQQRKDVTYNANTQYAHGPAGVFNVPGVNRDVWSQIPRPYGIASRLPMQRTTYWNELFEMLLPVTAGSGAEPADDCSKGPNPGDASVGFQYFPFGKTIRTTKAIDANRVGQLVNNAEPLDLNVINADTGDDPWLPDPARAGDFMNSELGLKYMTLGLEFQRVIEGETYTGNPASNSAATLGKLYFAGLAQLINTGKVDALKGNPLTALDSLIIPWGNVPYNGTVTLGGQVADIVTALGSAMNYLRARAMLTNSLPAAWALSGRYDLFYNLTAMWPCSYLTNGCTTLNGGTVFTSGAEQVAMRDEMRAPGNEGLWINGVRYPWIMTDQNTEGSGSGRRISDIFIVPLTARGRYTLYYEYFDMENRMLTEMRSVVQDRIWTSNAGLYLWTSDLTQFCLDITAKTEARLILRRPDLAARITNVGYTSVVPVNTSTPGSLYAIAAGNTTGITAGLYNGY